MRFRYAARPVLFLATAAVLAGGAARASSHSDAPLISQDPQANLTDVYAFIGTRFDDPAQNVLNVLVAVRPYSEPGAGPTYERFADNVRYSIHLTDPTTGVTQTRWDFHFSDVDPVLPPGTKNPLAILSYGLGTQGGPILAPGDARQNYTQTFRVERADLKGRKLAKPVVVAAGLQTAPPNVGLRTTPLYNDTNSGFAISGATTFASLDPYTRATIHTLPGGEVVWAGPRDDGFYADIAGVFDLFAARTLGASGGVDAMKGYNTLVYGMQISVLNVRSASYVVSGLGQTGASATGVGIYASTARRSLKLKKDGTQKDLGQFVQVSRLGIPLVNETLIPLLEKDRYNRTAPPDDAQYLPFVVDPELAKLMNLVLGTTFVTTGRSDLAAALSPDVLRVDTTTGPVRLSGQAAFSRLSHFGGDILPNGRAGGFPNGRRVGDDVVDILLTAIASGPTYGAIVPRGDAVNANDQVYHQVFPYLATPHSGAANRKDP